MEKFLLPDYSTYIEQSNNFNSLFKDEIFLENDLYYTKEIDIFASYLLYLKILKVDVCLTLKVNNLDCTELNLLRANEDENKNLIRCNC